MEKELGTVRNGSERPECSDRQEGRPPRMADADLDNLVETLATKRGQLPTLDEIIQASGGCQRSRAVAARRRAAHTLAAAELENQLHVPPAIDARHRAMMREWLELAREQVAPIMQAATDAAEERCASAEAAVQDARTNLEAANGRCAKLTDDVASLNVKVDRLERRIQRLVASEARWRSRAEERAVLLDRLAASTHSQSDTEVQI